MIVGVTDASGAVPATPAATPCGDGTPSEGLRRRARKPGPVIARAGVKYTLDGKDEATYYHPQRHAFGSARRDSVTSAGEGPRAAAARLLAGGGWGGMPPGAVSGRAPEADNPAGVAAVYAAKGRPAAHPLIVHLADAAVVDHFAAEVPDFARSLMAAFWPGPLTLILPRRAGVGEAAAGGQSSIGLRCPAHAVAQARLRACL